MRVPSKNWLEWTVFAVGLVCIGAVIAHLATDTLRSSRADASVIVRLGPTEARDGRRYVPVTLVNSGGKAAAGIDVEVLLERGTQVVERARFVVDLLPPEGTREGWVAFDSAGAAGDRIRTGAVAFGTP